MALEVPLDGMDTDKIGGFDKVQPGGFHFVVVALDEEGGDKGEMVVDFEIIRGTTENQEGKVQREYFSKELNKELPRRKIFALAIACGLTTKAELDKLKSEGKSPVIDFNQAVGRQGCFNLESNTWNDKVSTRLAWDEIYHPCDKRAAHIPVNVAMLKKAGIVLPAGRNPDGAVQSKPGSQAGAAAAASKPATSTPAASQQQAANVDDLLAGV